MLQQAIVENVQREELNPLEEAAAYQQLIEDFSLTHDDVATRVGKSRATITNTLRLLQLPPTIQRYLKEGTLRMGHARALLGTPDRAFQEQLARRAVGEDLSVREVEDTIRRREEAPDARAVAKEPAGARMRPPGLLELEELLGDYLETRVRISTGPRHGRVQIDFANLEDLEAHLPGDDAGPAGPGLGRRERARWGRAGRLQVCASTGSSTPRRTPSTIACATRRELPRKRRHGVGIFAWQELADDGRHAGLSQQAICAANRFVDRGKDRP